MFDLPVGKRLTVAELEAALDKAEAALGLPDIDDEPAEDQAEFERIGRALLRFD